jgi:hypothetical protein
VKLFEFANNFKQSQIKRRITMMSKMKSRGPAKLKLLLIVPMATLLLLAFAEPRPADIQVEEATGADVLGIKVTGKTAFTADPTGDQTSQEEKMKKMEQVKVELEKLKKEEQILRDKMDATEDPKLKADLKTHLKDVLTKEKVLAEALQNGELPPPPKAPTPPSPPPPPSAKKLELEYKILSEKADAIKAKLDKVTDDKEKSELKAALVEVKNRQNKIETMLAESNGSNGTDLKLDEMKKEYTLLEAKVNDLLAQIKNTDDPDVKAKCKQMLTELREKQEQIKIKAEALKTGKEGKIVK